MPAIADTFYIIADALKKISRQDPISGTCGPTAPDICENGCIGCVARKALKDVGLWPLWPEQPLVDIEWVQKALEIAGEGRVNTIKPDLLANLINRFIKSAANHEHNHTI